MANETMTFKEAYGVLQGHAETLRNIDNLLPIVEESVSAYRVCKERIDAVEKALEKALTDVSAHAAPHGTEEEGAARMVPAARPVRAIAPAVGPVVQKTPSGFDDMDDDIPF